MANIISKISTNQVQDALNDQIITLQQETSTAISSQDKKILNLHRTFQNALSTLIDETHGATKQIQEEIGKQLIDETILTNIEQYTKNVNSR